MDRLERNSPTTEFDLQEELKKKAKLQGKVNKYVLTEIQTKKQLETDYMNEDNAIRANMLLRINKEHKRWIKEQQIEPNQKA